MNSLKTKAMTLQSIQDAMLNLYNCSVIFVFANESLPINSTETDIHTQIPQISYWWDMQIRWSQLRQSPMYIITILMYILDWFLDFMKTA